MGQNGVLLKKRKGDRHSDFCLAHQASPDAILRNPEVMSFAMVFDMVRRRTC